MRKYHFIIFILVAAMAGVGNAHAAETVAYTYDEQGRLVALVTSGTVNNGENVVISIDLAGNRTTYTVAGS